MNIAFLESVFTIFEIEQEINNTKLNIALLALMLLKCLKKIKVQKSDDVCLKLKLSHYLYVVILRPFTSFQFHLPKNFVSVPYSTRVYIRSIYIVYYIYSYISSLEN